MLQDNILEIVQSPKKLWQAAFLRGFPKQNLPRQPKQHQSRDKESPMMSWSLKQKHEWLDNYGRIDRLMQLLEKRSLCKFRSLCYVTVWLRAVAAADTGSGNSPNRAIVRSQTLRKISFFRLIVRWPSDVLQLKLE